MNIKLDKEIILNFMKYLIIGGSAFVVEFALFLLLRMFLHYIAANILIYSFMFWAVFLANKFLNFKTRKNFRRQLIMYTILYFINLTAINLMLFGLSEYLMLDTAIGKFIVTGISCMWNFPLYKFVIYKEK